MLVDATLSVPPGVRVCATPMAIVAVVDVAVALSVGVPMQPVIPVKDVPVLPV